jgi:hypothetical protein
VVNSVVKNILGIVIAAAICGVTASLWQIESSMSHIGERLARIETKLWPDK